MLRNTVFVSLCALGFGAMPALASEQAVPTPATYILQVASNLECEALDVELISEDRDTRATIAFGTKAFGAASITPGTYTFGTVTCHQGSNGTETFDQLSTALPALQLASGRAYFGGKLMLEHSRDLGAEDAPDVVNQCIRGTGRFRKEPTDDCRDGIGIDTGPARIVNFYMPHLSDDEVAQVRAAFSATPEQLLYMPLVPADG